MFRRYWTWTGDTLRSTEKLRSSGSAAPGPAAGRIGDGA
jgi:hypothetical protein